MRRATAPGRLATLVAILLTATFAAGAAQPAAIVFPATGGAPWTGADITKLDSDLDTLLSTSPAVRGAHVGVLAIDTRSGATLYARNADDEFQPASTLKVLVGSAALDKLGPAFRFRTELDASGPASSGAKTFDSVVLVARGDPLLRMADLRDAAQSVAAHGGITPNRIFIDDSHFNAAPYPAGWVWDDFGQDYAPHISAMSLEENLLHLTVSPGSAVGSRALVDAASAASVGPFADGCIAAANTGIAVVPEAYTAPPSDESTIDVGLLPGGCLTVTGAIPLRAQPESVDAAVYDPLAYAATALADDLRKKGYRNTLALAEGGDDTGIRWPRYAGTRQEIVWSHTSAPLSEFVGPHFWIPSDNFVGEMLLRELGFAAGGKPGTTDKGLAYERTWLQSIGIDPATTTLADGSGLSQYDRITPRDLVAILQHDWNGRNRQLVLDSLPVGGARGTIEGIAGTPAAGRVFAKTGSMMHIRGLAGYLATQRHGAVTFDFSVDDWNGDYPALAALRAAALSRIIGDSGAL